MKNSETNLHRAIVNSIDDAIAVIDLRGDILLVNESWQSFARANGGRTEQASFRQNYLQVCDAAALTGDADSRLVATGLRALMSGKLARFEHEYPCHSPNEQRWYLLSAHRLKGVLEPCFVLAHKNITRRKLAEMTAHRISLTDTLTGLANRRHLDRFLLEAWRVHARASTPLSLLLLDIDQFKLYNDHYGHLKGDHCLQQVARCIAGCAKRPGDLAARFGGEELVLVLGDCAPATARQIGDHLLQCIRQLRITHAPSARHEVVTASVGVATAWPTPDTGPEVLISQADLAMYQAKSRGRNQVCSDGRPSESGSLRA